jgi:hypothetical protein
MMLRAAFVLLVGLSWPPSAQAHWPGIPDGFSAEAGSSAAGQPDRLSEVAFRILVTNAEICGRHTAWTVGMHAAVPDPIDAWSPAAESGAYPTVVSLIAGSPALESGLRMGDRIRALDNEDLPSGYPGADLLSHLLHENQGEVLHLAVDRGGVRHEVAVRPRRVCAYDVALFENDAANALAQENRVVLTTGMLDMLARDDDVAVVLAHEVAHIAAGHTTHGRYAQDAEPEADYLGVFLAARAGYDVSGAAVLLQRIAAARAGYYGQGGAAGIDARLRAIRAAVTEVAAQRAAGKVVGLPVWQSLNGDWPSESASD